ncbi:MAG: twin-arginine translocation signal domain-containing protein, partial [Verrucomicrobiota bacterium]
MEKAPRPSNPSRRSFVKGTIATAGAALAGQNIASGAQEPSQALSRPYREPEWRNKQAGMSYRRLGNTGLMVSEIVQGGSGPMTPDTYRRFEYAI